MTRLERMQGVAQVTCPVRIQKVAEEQTKVIASSMNRGHWLVTVIFPAGCLLLYIFWASGALASGHVLLQADASFHGEVASDSVWSSTYLDDVNGDGIGDLAVAVPQFGAGTNDGKIYVIFGSESPWPMGTDLADSDASYLAEAQEDYVGVSIDGAGDFDGDGYADIILGASQNDEAGNTAGKVYLIFGRQAPWNVDVSLSELDSSFLGENAGDSIGDAVAGIGDVNGDGIDDIAFNSSGNGLASVFFGDETRPLAGTSVDNADASMVADFGYPIAGGGDLNGDGFDDFLVGSYGYNHLQGRVRVVLGKATGWTTMSPPAAADAHYVGEHYGDAFGLFIALVGDVNGDGLADMAFGSPYLVDGGKNAGRVYILFGRVNGWAANGDIGTEADVVFTSEAGGDSASWVGAAGDVNNDSLADLLVGAAGSDEAGTNAGQAYLILGRTRGWASGSTLAVSDASILGEYANDLLGSQPNGGDLNGDGLCDVLVGAKSNDTYGSNTGQIYLVLGSECWDIDWDGHDSCSGDCDDHHDLTYPGAPEQCDGEDNDCDGDVDEGTDVDDDGDGTTECEGDCDDFDASRYPGATETCNGVDDDCDGELMADEVDEDLDGVMECDGDCDDQDDTIFPGAEEVCGDGVDNDCDGATDEDCGDDDDDDVADDDDDDTSAGDDDSAPGDDDDPTPEDCECDATGSRGPLANSTLLFLMLALLFRSLSR